jgi:DNA-directed RNA polymerase specialized sigma24 family protein
VLALLDTLQKQRPVGRQKFVDLLAVVLREKFTTWLKGIILKYSRYEYARWESRSETILQQYSDRRNPQDDYEYAELLRIVEEVRSQLSEEEWEALHNKYNTRDFSFRKYSEQTGVPLTTLYSRFQRAREKILNHKKIQEYWKK